MLYSPASVVLSWEPSPSQVGILPPSQRAQKGLGSCTSHPAAVRWLLLIIPAWCAGSEAPLSRPCWLPVAGELSVQHQHAGPDAHRLSQVPQFCFSSKQVGIGGQKNLEGFSLGCLVDVPCRGAGAVCRAPAAKAVWVWGPGLGCRWLSCHSSRHSWVHTLQSPGGAPLCGHRGEHGAMAWLWHLLHLSARWALLDLALGLSGSDKMSSEAVYDHIYH